MLSSKAKYAVRAAIRLAERPESEDWVQTADIAEQDRIPHKFLETILVQLRDHGVVESRRGAHGGHRLLRDPTTISIADIIRIVDGPLALTPCASVTRFRPCTDCVDIKLCRLQPLMRQARDAVAAVLENCSLASMVARQPKKKRVAIASRHQRTAKAAALGFPRRPH
ncbi:MAG TPA: Rrf2 family transcriptional regulator [Acetobacteraceae bacterium]|jgi:Rrf2 family protein|nr:Rrf2 family transcriptional regulator [Acetobacteraceae bacterium]